MRCQIADSADMSEIFLRLRVPKHTRFKWLAIRFKFLRSAPTMGAVS